MDAGSIADCLTRDRLTTPARAAEIDSLLRDGRALSRALRGIGDTVRARVMDSALARFPNFYRSGLLDDTARLNRLVDHLNVTQEYVTGRTVQVAFRHYSAVTPGVAWHYYPYTGAGIFIHPLETVQSLGSATPDSLRASTDSLIAIGHAFWKYPVWYVAGGRRFPIWEYLFKNEISDAATRYRHLLRPPWRSSMPQGDIVRLYSILYQRTGDEIWARRARSVLEGFDIPWSAGGLRLDDTTHGYWYEEALPEAMIWNGSMQALIDVGVYAKTFPGDSLGQRLWRRGLDAAEYYTPLYDTGSWLVYSRVQGNVAAHYRNFCVALALALSRMTGDTLQWKSYARRWAAYSIPSGTCIGGPCNDAPPPPAIP
ncbi:MAG TPA: D-glucuronyl C5-epimerase family protein [Gemmatimonadaceae bacterium]|nr:D-glucuronyl C5-epimerase family protein [Gemmatimonadaceae bacterium]